MTEDHPRILFVCPSDASFIRVDREVLAERWPVEVWRQPGRFTNLFKLLPMLWRADVVVGWWASWHTFWPFTLAALFRKPSLLIVGGFDTANMPEIGYGYQQGGLRRGLSRWIMRRATKLVTNSHYSQGEIERNIGFPPERVEVVHHGVPDPYGELPPDEGRRRMALSVGFVTRDNLEIKGQRAFVEAAAELPDVEFVLAGPWKDDGVDVLRARATPNVTLTGWLEQDELDRLFREASVYVQPSHHEGFGIAVAEAMLAGLRARGHARGSAARGRGRRRDPGRRRRARGRGRRHPARARGRPPGAGRRARAHPHRLPRRRSPSGVVGGGRGAQPARLKLR